MSSYKIILLRFCLNEQLKKIYARSFGCIDGFGGACTSARFLSLSNRTKKHGFFLTNQVQAHILCSTRKGGVRLKVTIKQIADIVGVSRGTVDRALHNRGEINPQVREQILSVASSLGYRPNAAGKNLSVRKQRLKFGFILPTRFRGFWYDVHLGIDAVADELSEYGVTVFRREFHRYTASEQVALIDELMEAGISGLAIVPINEPPVQEKLNVLVSEDFPVVIVNTEIEFVMPLCSISADYIFSGRTAAGILGLIARERHTELLIFTGTKTMLSHIKRVTGFLQEIDRLHLDCHLIGIEKLYDKAEVSDAEVSFEIAASMLKKHPETTAVFTAAGAVHAVAKAIQECGMADQITHLSFDLNDTTLPALQNGSLTAVISQESFKQGYQPIKLLFEYVVNGIQPPSRRIILQNEIFIQQNATGDSPYAEQSHPIL